MAVSRSFGRRQRRDPPLAALAQVIAAAFHGELEGGCLVEIVAHGDSIDYPEWVTLRFHARSIAVEDSLADSFAERITRFGATLV